MYEGEGVTIYDHRGADLVINTRKEDFVERVKAWKGEAGADVVIDNLGGDVLVKSTSAGFGLMADFSLKPCRLLRKLASAACADGEACRILEFTSWANHR